MSYVWYHECHTIYGMNICGFNLCVNIDCALFALIVGTNSLKFIVT